MTGVLCAVKGQGLYLGVLLSGSKVVFISGNYYIHCTKCYSVNSSAHVTESSGAFNI